ncbi:hypothetical protein AB0M80_04790 [Amycolatopsis sp. NPDC051045]|uniref:hypothetical protein n=1 Tax=Amycolatopsis sp. NPDC051045 TaxID=3156922 RepID=UPI00343EE9A5
MTITAQWVHTSWTKRSRGGTAAAIRNGTPAGFVLPALPPGTAHVVRMREDTGFAPESSEESLRGMAVALREVDGRLRVLSHAGPGLPPRTRRPPAVRLAPGEWVRWRLNHRYSSASGIRGWSYWLDTFNIAYGEVPREVFLGEPRHFVDEQGPVR